MKKIIHFFALALILSSCLEEHNDLIPELEGEPAGGIIDIDIESINEDEMILNVDLFAVDHLGGFISNLGINDFSISENSSNAYDVEFIEVIKRGQEERGPFSATMLFDQSGSINSTDPYDARVEAGIKFAEIVTNGDEASVVAFTSGGSYTSPYEILTPFTDDQSVLIPPIQDLANKVGGGTPLYTSIHGLTSYTNNSAKNENKAIIAFTDGADTGSDKSVQDVIESACQNNTRIYTVGLGNGVSYSDLYEIAFETDGAVMLAENAIQLVSLYNSMGNLLHGQGEFFTVKMKLKKQNGIWTLSENIFAELELLLNNTTSLAFPIIKRIKAGDFLNFYEKVPDCPCNYNTIQFGEEDLCSDGKWCDCGDDNPTLQDFHFGATFEIRWIPRNFSKPGQQCTYDASGQLITSGIAAGTPDIDAPFGCKLPDAGHLLFDVAPAYIYSCQDYLAFWPPNNDNACQDNAINDFSHMYNVVSGLNCIDVISFIKLADSNDMDETLSQFIKGNANSTPSNIKDLLQQFLNSNTCNDGDCDVIQEIIDNLG